MKIENIELLKSNSLGHSLIKVGRVYDEYAFATLKPKINNSRLKPSHMQLFPAIPFEGISIVKLAKKLEISKQAVSALVSDMLDMKILKKFDMKKNSGILKGMKLLSELDNDLIELLGDKKAILVNQALKDIIKEVSSRE